MLDGVTINRNKNDKPDIIRQKEKNGKKLFFGIEHFFVEQVSFYKKGSRVSVIKEKRSYAEKIIDSRDTIMNEPTQRQKAKEKIVNAVFDIAAQTNKSGIDDLKESFEVAWGKHLFRADEYRKNMIQLADGNPIKLVYLIEVRSNADDVFLNNGNTVIRRRNNIYPVFTWMVEALEKANPRSIDYVILYLTNPIFTEIEDVIAVEIKDIRGSLRKQGIVVYEYCNDPSNIEFITHNMTENGFEYTIEVKNKYSFDADMIPVLRQAYEYKHNSRPFVVSRSVQAIMYTYGKAQFISGAAGIKLISEFPKEVAMQRFEDFIKKFPPEG